MPELDGAAQLAQDNAAKKGLVDLKSADVEQMLLAGGGDISLGDSSQAPEPAAEPITAEGSPSVTPAQETNKPQVQEEQEQDELVNLEFDPETGEIKLPEPVQKKPDQKLSDEERWKLWQSNYDREREKAIRLEAELNTLKQLQTQKPAEPVQPVQPQPRQTQFLKTPADFMPAGQDYVAYDAGDPNTLSGQAFNRWMQERDSFMVNSVRDSVLATITEKETQKRREESLEKQISYLKTKLPDYNDDKIRDLLSWAMEPRENQLYLVALARDLSQGRFPLLNKKTLTQLAQAYAPNGGKPSVASLPEGSKPSSVPDENKELSAFSDWRNATL